MPCVNGTKNGRPYCFTHGDWPQSEACLRARIAELEAALTHAVEIAEDKRIGGTWDDLLPYRALLNKKS